MSSVRFICGSARIYHKQLEKGHRRLLRHRGHDPLCRHASMPTAASSSRYLRRAGRHHLRNALNHASIIDGVRLCKAVRYRYANADMGELERVPQEGPGTALPHHLHRRRLLDGRQRRAAKTVSAFLAEKYDALVMVDECHSAGVARQDGPRQSPNSTTCCGQCRHPDGYARQGLRRRRGRLHDRPQGDHRHAAPAFAPLPLLELAAARRRGGRDRTVSHAGREQRAARPPRGRLLSTSARA